MAQVLPQLQGGIGQQLREALVRSTDFYLQRKEQQNEREAYQTLLDPNASSEQKASALPKIKDIGSYLKYQTHMGTQNAINEFQNARKGNNVEQVGPENTPRLNQPTQVSDQDVGGQANEDFLGVDTEKAPSMKSPSAPSQVIQKPQDAGGPKIDDLLLNIARYNPQLANTLTNIESKGQREKTDQQKLALRRELGENKLKQEKELFEANVKEKHNESHKDFDSTLSTDAKAAQNRLHAYAEIEPELKSGKLDPKRIRNFIANRASGTQWEGIFSSDAREKLKLSGVFMYDGMKDLFGGQLTDSKLKIASNKVIDPTKTPSANLAVINFKKYYDESKVNERKIGDEIKKANGGYRPIDFDVQIRDRMEKEYGQEAKKKMNLALTGGVSDKDIVTMRDKKTGKSYEVPAEDVEQMLNFGEIVNG